MKVATALLLAAGILWTAPARASDVEMESEPGLAGSEGYGIDSDTEAMPPVGQVSRSTFTTDVVNREPQDSITELTNDNVRVFYFTELRDMSGQTVYHRWEHDGVPMGEVPFTVGGPRWRVYSVKSLEPEWTGEWTVTVVDSAGRTLASDSFALVEAGSAGGAPGTATAVTPPSDAEAPAAPAP